MDEQKNLFEKQTEEQKAADELEMQYEYAEGAAVALTEQKENVLFGIAGALIGCAIGALAIVLLGQFGYIASICGVLMGFCTYKGYMLLAKGISVKGIIVCAVIMIVMVYMSNMISYGFAVAEVYEVDKLTGISAVHWLLAEGAIDPVYFFKDLFMLMVFTAIGAVPEIKRQLKK